MKYWIFVNRKKVSIELKFSSLMSFKCLPFLRVFSGIPGVELTLGQYNFFLQKWPTCRKNCLMKTYKKNMKFFKKWVSACTFKINND